MIDLFFLYLTESNWIFIILVSVILVSLLQSLYMQIRKHTFVMLLKTWETHGNSVSLCQLPIQTEVDYFWVVVVKVCCCCCHCHHCFSLRKDILLGSQISPGVLITCSVTWMNYNFSISSYMPRTQQHHITQCTCTLIHSKISRVLLAEDVFLHLRSVNNHTLNNFRNVVTVTSDTGYSNHCNSKTLGIDKEKKKIEIKSPWPGNEGLILS